MALDPNHDVAELMRYSGVRWPKRLPPPATPIPTPASDITGVSLTFDIIFVTLYFIVIAAMIIISAMKV